MKSHLSKPLRIAVILSSVLAGSGPSGTAAVAAGTGPVAWVQSSYDDFRAGDLVSLSLEDDGEVRLAPELTLVGATREAYVWAVDQADDGSVFVSAGTDGVVYRFGPGAEAVEPEAFFDADGTVHSMALGPDGRLYVAASPGGAIWRLPIDGGPVRASDPWLTIDAPYVWALAFGPDGSLYAGTGDGGEIHRVAPDGIDAVLYDSNEAHITALAIDAEGNVLAGSSDNGRLYRIAPGGDAFVLFDSPMKQITGVVPSGGAVFFAALEQGVADSAGDHEDAEAPAIAGSSGEDALRGAVYVMHEGGLVEQLWGSSDETAHALAPAAGGVVVGTGGDGRLFRVGLGPTAVILGSADASQITALRARPEELIVGTSNLGRVYRLRNSYRRRGELLSQVKDTATTSQWGRVRWRGEFPEGTAVRLYTRSGNTDDPDETWSDWSAPYDDPAGSRIASPAARFVQWRAELTTDLPGTTPMLEWVEVIYIQRNLRPEIDRFTVHPAGVVFRQNSSFEDGLPIGRLPSPVREALAQQQGRDTTAPASGSSFLGQAYYLPGSQTFTWEASDSNGDQMLFSLGFRGEGESTWKPVATELSETSYLWDTTTVPDGLYRVRLTASDAPSNPAGSQLDGSRASEPFVVDNTAPRIDNLTASGDSGAIRVTGVTVDETSLIRSIEYAVDGGEWRAVLPADGLPDASNEEIDFATVAMEPGERTIVVRVTDNALNSGTSKLVVTVR